MKRVRGGVLRLRNVRNIGAQCRRFETTAAAAAHPRHHIDLFDLAKPPAALGQPRRRGDGHVREATDEPRRREAALEDDLVSK